MTLQNVVAGDLVGIEDNGGWRRNISGPFVVDRTTKTKVVFSRGEFNRKGEGFGASRYSRSRCVPWTDELAAEQAQLEAERAAERLCRDLSEKLARARNEEAVRLASMVSDNLKAEAKP